MYEAYNILLYTTLTLLFLCWGSFLNVLGYRLIRGTSIISPRSFCPACKHTIAWYDNIPVLSWILLGRRCRHCKEPISFLYPFIEISTACILLLLFVRIPHQYFFAYFIFFSALIVTIRSDMETMLISRFVTIFLIPLGFLLSMLGFLPINLGESMLGCLCGFLILYIISKVFWLATRTDGLGQGDIELLAFIGAFVGPLGAWLTLFIGSLLGTLVNIPYMIVTKKKTSQKIPFGPYLALGAILYVLFKDTILMLLF